MSMSGIGPTKTLAIDVDSVLADTMIVWTDEYNIRTGARISKSEIQLMGCFLNSAYLTFQYFMFV